MASSTKHDSPLVEWVLSVTGDLWDPRPEVYIYKTFLHLRPTGYWARWDRKIVEIGRSGTLLWGCLLGTSETTPTRVSRHALNKDNINGHTKADGGSPTRLQPYRKKHRQLRKIGSRRERLLQGRASQLLVQCQMVMPNGHPWKRIKTNITKTEQAIFRDKYECLYIYTITIIEDKKAINLKENRERYMEGIKVGKGKKKCVNSVIKSFV